MKNLLFVFVFTSVSAFGQEFNFVINNSSLSKYVEMEESLGSERIPTTSNHISFSGEAQPFKYKRKQKVIPDLTVYYFFKEKDSTISYILYEWDVYNFEQQDNNQKSEDFQKALIAKYKNLKEIISNDYGNPEVKRNYSNISKLDSLNTFVESSTWRPDEKITIKLSSTVSNYYQKKSGVIINPVHRIRLYVETPKN